MNEAKATRTRMGIQKLMRQADREFTEVILEKFDVSNEDIEEFLNKPDIPKGGKVITHLNMDEHEAFVDICYLQCTVMDTGEVVSGGKQLGYAGETIPMKHLWSAI